MIENDETEHWADKSDKALEMWFVGASILFFVVFLGHVLLTVGSFVVDNPVLSAKVAVVIVLVIVAPYVVGRIAERYIL